MGFGAYMVVANQDDRDHQLTVNNINCMYDNGDEGSNLQVWNNVTIKAGSNIPATGKQYIEVKASGSCAFETSSFTLNIDDITSVTILEKNNQYYCNGQFQSVSVNIDNSGSQAQISIIIN